MRFSKKEWKDLGKAWFFISLAFAIAFSGLTNLLSPAFGLALLVSGVTVGLGFLLHELAHKFFAQRYGMWAEFRAWDKMLYLAVLLSFFGFIFAAPGGVMIKGHISKRRHGIIALAGPMMNVVLGILFIPVMLIPGLSVVGMWGVRINALLAVFNLLPILLLDGVKVLQWNKGVYAVSLLIAGSFAVFAFA